MLRDVIWEWEGCVGAVVVVVVVVVWSRCGVATVLRRSMGGDGSVEWVKGVVRVWDSYNAIARAAELAQPSITARNT